jgi:hypothetical protein
VRSSSGDDDNPKDDEEIKEEIHIPDNENDHENAHEEPGTSETFRKESAKIDKNEAVSIQKQLDPTTTSEDTSNKENNNS